MELIRAVRLGAEGPVLGHRVPGEGVRVRVTSAGICGSDLHLSESPVVVGHEFGGLLDDGTLVAVRPLLPCGECPSCVGGREQLCAEGRRRFYGGTLDGGLADQVWVDPSSLVPAPGVEPTAVSLVEPIAVAVHAVERAGPADRVLVIGGGTIGLLCAAVLRDRGVPVDVSVRHEHQAAVAHAVGAGATSGRYPVVIDAAGTASSWDQAARAAEPGGRVVLVALPWEPLGVTMRHVFHELDVISAAFYTGDDFVEAAAVLARRPELCDLLVTHRFGLEQAPEAFRVAADRKAGAIKVQLLP
jgi:threonine dehydrogenase-like Zn-dependent dehydrogenase